VTTPEHRVVSPSHLRISLAFLALSLAVFGASASLSAEAFEQKKSVKPYALIYGTVYGPDNRAVYGVKVFIRRADQKKPKWELRSDHAGEFAQRLPAGRSDYLVWAEVKGLKLLNGKTLTAGEPVVVHIENDERADIGLHLK